MTEIERTPSGAPRLHTCGRRIADYGPWERGELLDRWRILPNGDRTCSFCGSLHHDDFYKLVVASLELDSPVRIEQSDKTYKVYVHRPDVLNASQGGIKFYKHHDTAWTPEQMAEVIRIWPDVLRRSHMKFEQYMETIRLRFPKTDPPVSDPL